MDPPPCLRPGEPMNPCARALYAYEVNATTDLPADWLGWRLRGRVLISPDGDRITPARLRGLLFVEANQKRASKKTTTGQVVRFSTRGNSGLQGDESSNV